MSDEVETAANIQVDTVEEWQRPRLVSILFCDSYQIRDDGKADLTGIFDRIYVHPERRHTPPFWLYVRTAETTDAPIRIVCRAPDGGIPTMANLAPINKEEYTPNLPANYQGIVHMNPFYVSAGGVYWVDVRFNGKSLGGAALAIELRETEDKAGGTDTYI